MSNSVTTQPQLNLLSVIVPVGSRRTADIKQLYAEYKEGVSTLGVPYEFVFVLDEPRADVSKALEELLQRGEDFTVVKLTRTFGEAAALMAGFEKCSGNTILTLLSFLF